MAPDNTRLGMPAISITRSDHERLSELAEALHERNPAVGDQLFSELDRARVVAEGSLPRDVVRMGSTLRFATDAGDNRTVTLVYPGEADIALGRVSVVTPIGASLIGLAAGQSIDWTGRDGRRHRLTVERVMAEGPERAMRPAP